MMRLYYTCSYCNVIEHISNIKNIGGKMCCNSTMPSFFDICFVLDIPEKNIIKYLYWIQPEKTDKYDIEFDSIEEFFSTFVDIII